MKLSAHLDLDVVAHESDDEVSVLLDLVAPQPPADADRVPGTLVVVLDRSGSMAGDRLDAAKTALLALVDRLDPQDSFGLVTFDDAVDVAVPAGPLTDKPRVKQAIAAVTPGGSTDLSAGYFRGLQEARRVAGPEAGATTVLLVSDGHANAGLTDPGRLGEIARTAYADGVTTSTLGMGLGYDERLLSAIARGGSGNEHFAETADEAVPLIAREVDGLLALAAQAASLLIRMSPYVRGVRVVNDLPSASVPGGVMVELGSFYAGETRKLVLTFDVPGIPALGLAEIAALELRYVALPALEQQVITVPLHVNVVPGDQAAGRVPDPVVRTELAFLQAQRAKREASTALSVGDVGTARRSLGAAAAMLRSVAAYAPAAYALELDDELALVAQLEQEAESDSTRAAKRSSADASLKSRLRGRSRPSSY